MIFMIVKMRSIFYSNLVKMFDKHFPITKMKSRYHKLTWLTKALKLSIKTKNRLYIKYKIHKTAFNEMQYITYKNKLKYVMKIQEIKYYNELVHLNKDRMKKTWDTIKCVINKTKPSSGSSNFLIDGKLTNDKNLIANKFNEYFTSVGINLFKKIPDISNSFKQFMKGNYVQCMVLKEVNIDEKIILALKMVLQGLTIFQPVSLNMYWMYLHFHWHIYANCF